MKSPITWAANQLVARLNIKHQNTLMPSNRDQVEGL